MDKKLGIAIVILLTVLIAISGMIFLKLNTQSDNSSVTFPGNQKQSDVRLNATLTDQSNNDKDTNAKEKESRTQKQVTVVEQSTKEVLVEKSIEEIAQKKKDIVVVICDDAMGSGIILNKNGDILTNFHVISQLAKCFIALDNGKGGFGEQIPVTINKFDKKKDLALLKADCIIGEDIVLGDLKELREGQKVVAIGNPQGLVNTVSDGIISGIRQVDGVALIQITAPITYGSSGGALFNTKGELIGITTSGFEGNGNLNFAVSSADIQAFLENKGETVDVNVTTENDIAYNQYSNERYGFSITYPLEFEQNVPPANGDGLGFHSKDNKAELVAFGSNNVLDYTIQDIYNESISNIKGTISYKALKDNWFVLSWSEDGRIFYSKTFIGKGSTNTFILSYPQEQNALYAPVVEHINNTFIPGDLDVAH